MIASARRDAWKARFERLSRLRADRRSLLKVSFFVIERR